MPASFRTKPKSSTSQQQSERQRLSDKPELENSSDHEGLVHNTKEIDEQLSTQSKGNPLNCKSSNRNKAGSGGSQSGEHRIPVLGRRGRGGSGDEGHLIGCWLCDRGQRGIGETDRAGHKSRGNARALCECKSRGEFVQREHVIKGVEFFYQPPPKIALPRLKNSSHSLKFSQNNVWSMTQLHSPAFGCNCFEQFKHHDCFKPKDDAVYDRHLVSPDKNRGGSMIGSRNSWP
ncbi:hypothetical protein SUGI_0627190 [Cryptomeria japonica]|nr:hypothetical protein SUGI_0627190 [Cryptomeria japonica]